MESFVVMNLDGSHPHGGMDYLHVGLDLGQRKWVAGVVYLKDWSYSTNSFSGDDAWQQCVEWLTFLAAEHDAVHVLYEAGRNGFELARQLRAMGIAADIVSVSRLDRHRGRKRSRSDRLDAKRLAYMDYLAPGFPLVWVPSREQECIRGQLAWWEALVRQVRRQRNEGVSILARWGVPHRCKIPADVYEKMVGELEREAVVPSLELQRLRWAWEEEKRGVAALASLQKRMAGYDRELRAVAHEADREYEVDRLVMLRGIGVDSARRICWYVGDWSRFRSGRSFAAYCGLTSVHDRSGGSDNDLGISKAGNRVLRRTLVQLAISFFQWQPECRIVMKWEARRGPGGGTCRRIAKVALAREIAVALWRWLVKGDWPEGAIMTK